MFGAVFLPNVCSLLHYQVILKVFNMYYYVFNISYVFKSGLHLQFKGHCKTSTPCTCSPNLNLDLLRQCDFLGHFLQKKVHLNLLIPSTFFFYLNLQVNIILTCHSFVQGDPTTGSIWPTRLKDVVTKFIVRWLKRNAEETEAIYKYFSSLISYNRYK